MIYLWLKNGIFSSLSDTFLYIACVLFFLVFIAFLYAVISLLISRR